MKNLRSARKSRRSNPDFYQPRPGDSEASARARRIRQSDGPGGTMSAMAGDSVLTVGVLVAVVIGTIVYYATR